MVSLTDEQNRAMNVLKERIKSKEDVTIFQGVAGSGKTTTLSVLLQELGYDDYRVHFCAFTGNAAKILMDNGLSASTIHKLIYNPIVVYGKVVGFKKKHPEELSHLKLIVVDEFSMIDEKLMDDLLSYGIPLLLVGDHYQLPPIGRANKFVKSYHAKLETVMRQALESPVLWAATQIREGKTVKNGVYGQGNNSLKVGRKHELNDDWLRKDVQFIVGLNQTRHKLNEQISGSKLPEKGDKIIFLKNDWDSFIVNGSKTKIKNIEKNWNNKYYLEFDYDGNHYSDYFVYYQSEPENARRNKKSPKNVFDKSYAITCHKAQGSTIYQAMVIIDESEVFRQNKLNWQYTALTRSAGIKPVAFLR